MGLSIVILAVLLAASVCNGQQSNHGATTFLKAKWETWFKKLDINHNNVLSKEDIEKTRSKFSELHPSYEYSILTKWWNDCILRGKTGEVTKSGFVTAMDKDFTTDKNKFRIQRVECAKIVYGVTDANKDKSFSEAELHNMLKVFGYANDVLDTKFFQAYKPVDGLVPLSSFVDSWVNFVTSEDASKGRIVKTFLEDSV